MVEEEVELSEGLSLAVVSVGGLLYMFCGVCRFILVVVIVVDVVGLIWVVVIL